MTLLSLETSCDETSAAVVRDGVILANVVSSQTKLHAEFGGVVPELATREHLRNLQPVTSEALREASISPGDLDAVAATQGPGLPAALMVGLRAAQTMAFALDRPFLGIHHHEAHLYSPWIWADSPEHSLRQSPSPLHGERGAADDSHPCLRAHFDAFQPNVSLVVSGGHTLLVHVRAELDHTVLGSTIDDAAGECFDKTAKLLGLPYPGGPLIDQLAEHGNPRRFGFPRPLLRDPGDDFSFSGLKTSVRYFLRDNPALLDDAMAVRDLCAGVQAAIVEVLVSKTMRAAERLGVKCVTASGGVTCNRALRSELAKACERRGFTLRVAERALCTDNAGMIGVLAERRLARGLLTSLDADITPGLALS